jgi:large conductance mechanosensitive channel
MKSFISEFKEFALRGNVMDMAVGIIIGAAFTAIVTALVNNIISPIIGMFVKVDFNHLVATVNGVELQYGAFIMAIVNFILIALVLFLPVFAVKRKESRETSLRA